MTIQYTAEDAAAAECSSTDSPSLDSNCCSDTACRSEEPGAKHNEGAPSDSNNATLKAPLRWWHVASVVAVGMLTFWSTVSFDFVNWDDPAYVLHNDLIKSWAPSNLAGVATETVTRNYAPLTIFSLLVDHTLWGTNPSGYHATNVLLHVINGVLVLLLVRQLTGSNFVAWMTAALFLVHPVQIETVAWISSRKGLLSASFMLAALIARLRPEPEAKHDGWYLLWLSAALLSKALAVVVPAIVLLYDVWVRRQKFSDAFVRQVIPGLLCVLLLLKTIASQHSILGGIRHHLDYSIFHIMAIDTTIMWRYIGMLLCPTDLCVMYNPQTTGITNMVIAASIGWAAVAGLIWQIRKQSPIVMWAAASYLLLLFPVLNFFRITTLMNDRYLYLPCIIFFALAAGGVQRLLAFAEDRQDIIRRCSIGLRWSLGAAAVCIACVLTTSHLPVWTNARSLWAHAMEHSSDLTVVRIQQAYTLHDSGQSREAIMEMQRALLYTQPDDLDQERIAKAIREWREELQLRTAERRRRFSG